MKILIPITLTLLVSASIVIAANQSKSDSQTGENKDAKHAEEKGHDHGDEKHDEVKEGHKEGDEHGHEGHNEAKEGQKAGDEHGHEGHDEAKEGHEEGDEHGHEEEKPRFGPNKGVTEASEKIGFKLNDHAFQNFKIEVTQLSGTGTWKIPSSAIVYSREETHVYRFKDGFFKSIDVKIQNKSNEIVTISAKDLKPGDQIASKGTGFLMIVDQAVFGEELAHEH